jgi:hypothetical protein
MTIEITEFKCPTCGHLMGEEEYIHACSEFHKVIHTKLEEQRNDMIQINEDKLSQQSEKHKRELQEQEKIHKEEINTKVNQEVRLRLDEREKEQKKEFDLQLKQKEKEIEVLKLQRDNVVNDKITEVREEEKQKNRQEKAQYELQLERIQKHNDELQKTLDNIPSEFKGQVGEIMLLDELHKAFPQDDLTPKKVGVRMPDVIQTIVTESKERICTPILWDMKTGETITQTDVDKAKNYKEKYNTDYCIIVSANGINKKSKYYQTELIGKGDGVLLVHRKIAVVVAELTRNFLIENRKLIINNNGRASKQTKLYDYITSSARFRRMQEKIKQKLKLVALQSEEEDRVKKIWNDRKKIIEKLDELDKEDQDIIDSIIQEDEANDQAIEKGYEGKIMR